MDLGVISVRYARALLKAGLTDRQEDELYRDMQILSQSFFEVPELRFTIDNPMLMKDKKQALLEIACGPGVSSLTKKFIALVLKEDRENALQFMAASYITLYRKYKNITRGKLITATVVSQDMERRMKQLVENKTKGSVEFNTEIDKGIIGGFILEYDTYRMDASVKSKLRKIMAELKK
ncbi:F0F1 ATP synthase subunit delta [Prevotella sp. A2931]|uniref:ATP synthase subunit delta n=1 Tax=Prevotella illustrans TaxID=2800387 RepID=A0ABS3M3W8_9BACT|nr:MULTISPECIES: F0F1 ATP synthase subunit delta [Prevotella]MBO1362776.1 F0F1 ATP synthase subunit delta [Prevotella illustrans]PTL25768.1 ATP synthase F1 subunit delta [Prevotella sp. oral taxon 820]